MPGCRGVEALRHVDRPDEFMVHTRWDSEADHDAYRRDPAFREEHQRTRDVPGGIRVARVGEGVDRDEVLRSVAGGMRDDDFAGLTAEAERLVVDALGLEPVALDPVLALALGTWRDRPARIETRAYAGPTILHARFATVKAATVEIGNLLVMPRAEWALPVFGADLVSMGGRSAMIAADISPTLPPGPVCDAQVAALAGAFRDRPVLPSGGELPAWCAAWFSPHALYTRPAAAELSAAVAAFRAFAPAYVELALATPRTPELAADVRAFCDGYAAGPPRGRQGAGRAGAHVRRGVGGALRARGAVPGGLSTSDPTRHHGVVTTPLLSRAMAASALAS
jgi:phycocyanobilin:ferredoxin oxidoreductase